MASQTKAHLDEPQRLSLPQPTLPTGKKGVNDTIRTDVNYNTTAVARPPRERLVK